MKIISMKKLFAIFYIASLFACSQQNNHRPTERHVANQKVKCYRQHSKDKDGGSTLIYWYMIWTLNNQCYYYSSASPVTDYSSISWQKSDVSPISEAGLIECEELPEQEVSQMEMSPEMQAEMSDNAEYFGGMNESEMGDYENSGDYDSEDNGSDNSDGGYSDGGSSDGGGGDGGGGGE